MTSIERSHFDVELISPTPKRGEVGWNKAEDKTDEQRHSAMLRRQRNLQKRASARERAKRTTLLAERKAWLVDKTPKQVERAYKRWAREDAEYRATRKSVPPNKTLINHTCQSCNRPFTSYRRSGPNQVVRCPSCRREARLLSKRNNWARHKDQYNQKKKDAGTYGELWHNYPKDKPKTPDKPVQPKPVPTPISPNTYRQAPPPPIQRPGQPVVVWQPTDRVDQPDQPSID